MNRMLGWLQVAGLLLIGVLLCSDAGAGACNCGIVLHCCPELGQYELTFARRFTGDYRPGEPYDVMTIAPSGGLETWEAVGIRLRVRIVCSCTGEPIAGMPAQEIALFNSNACWCPGGNNPSQDTDAEGWTEFTGMMRGGGCAQSLTMFVDGVAIGTFPIQINSPDTSSGNNCGVDSSDLAAFAAALGNPAQYTICLDFNESGMVDASDLAYFASVLGSQCQ